MNIFTKMDHKKVKPADKTKWVLDKTKSDRLGAICLKKEGEVSDDGSSSSDEEERILNSNNVKIIVSEKKIKPIVFVKSSE